MLTGEQIPDKGDLLKMTNDSNSAKIKRRKTLLSILGNVLPTLAILLERLVPNILHTNGWQFHQLENQVIENCSLYGFTTQDKDSSISTKQHLDDFERALGEFLKGLIGHQVIPCHQDCRRR